MKRNAKINSTETILSLIISAKTLVKSDKKIPHFLTLEEKSLKNVLKPKSM